MAIVNNKNRSSTSYILEWKQFSEGKPCTTHYDTCTRWLIIRM